MTGTKSQSNQQINSVIVDQSRFDPLFVYYSLRLMRDELRKRAAGAATPILNKSAFSDLTIEVPSFVDQRRIASILGAYDDLIEVNRRRIALLEEMARRLFEEWFVRFRFPGHDGHSMVKTAEHSIPKGWEVGVLGDLLELAYGRALKADTRVPGSVPVVGSSGVIGWHNSPLVKGPGIVVGRKGNVGSIIWCPRDFYPIDTVFFVQTRYPLRCLLHLLRRLTFLNSDAAVPGLNRSAALHIPILIPPVDLMLEFDARVEPMLDLAENYQGSNVRLAEARDLLLPRLITGELSVSAVEWELEKAA